MTAPTVSTAGLLTRAASFAADRHKTQRRKDSGATPYINHPLAVANILANECGVEDVCILAAAMLHDTVEDTETSLSDIETLFGEHIASIVAEVTDDKALPKEQRKQLQVVNASGKSAEAKQVKLADKISNLRDIVATPPANWSLERRQQYFDFARAVADGLSGQNTILDKLFNDAFSSRPRTA